MPFLVIVGLFLFVCLSSVIFSGYFLGFIQEGGDYWLYAQTAKCPYILNNDLYGNLGYLCHSL